MEKDNKTITESFEKLIEKGEELIEAIKQYLKDKSNDK